MKKVYAFIEQYLPYVMFLAICFVMLLQVFMRSIFRISFSWSIELSQYINVWLTFIGIAFLRKLDSHIKIEMFSSALGKHLPGRFNKIYILVKKGLNIIFILLLLWFGFEMARRSWNLRSPAMQLRQTFLYMSVPIGALGYLIRDILDIVEIAKNDREKN